MANKVKFNLKDVYYSVVTETISGGTTTYAYGTPVAWPGAVSLSLDAEGGTNTFYADGIAYYVTVANNGYSGDFESALIPDSFKTDVLGETANAQDGTLAEYSTAEVKPFALLFQFDGDQNAIKHVLYNCKCTRPSIGSQTNEDTKEVRTETLTITASPRADGLVKASCNDESGSAYANWTTAVYVP